MSLPLENIKFQLKEPKGKQLAMHNEMLNCANNACFIFRISVTGLPRRKTNREGLFWESQGDAYSVQYSM